MKGSSFYKFVVKTNPIPCDPNGGKMSKRDLTDPSSSEEPINGSDDNDVPEYEKQRLLRISENNKRMEALGLAKLASSFLGLGKNARKIKINKKGKGNDADEDYNPVEDGDEIDDWDEGDEDFVTGKTSRSRSTKEKNKGSKSKKNTFVEESSNLNHGDDDNSLRQAIELSLQKSAEFSDVQVQSSFHNVKRKNVKTQEVTGSMKRKRLFTSRMQMSEDELIANFYYFDDSWKGSISVSDLKRVATAHDFTWSDKELRDMINCFDSDGDEKLSHEDFQRIVGRCNMIKGPTPS